MNPNTADRTAIAVPGPAATFTPTPVANGALVAETLTDAGHSNVTNLAAVSRREAGTTQGLAFPARGLGNTRDEVVTVLATSLPSFGGLQQADQSLLVHAFSNAGHLHAGDLAIAWATEDVLAPSEGLFVRAAQADVGGTKPVDPAKVVILAARLAQPVPVIQAGLQICGDAKNERELYQAVTLLHVLVVPSAQRRFFDLTRPPQIR